MRSMILLSVVMACGFAAEKAEAPLPIAAQKALNVLSAEILSAKQKGAEELRSISAELAKKGDLDGALLVKKAAEELDAEIKQTQTVDALGNPLDPKAVGK